MFLGLRGKENERGEMFDTAGMRRPLAPSLKHVLLQKCTHEHWKMRFGLGAADHGPLRCNQTMKQL